MILSRQSIRFMKTILTLAICTAIALSLTACGFSPRSASDVPPSLHILYLDSPNPYSPLVVQLQRTLQSVDVHIVNTIDEAPVILRIITNDFYYHIPTILDSGDAVTYSYTVKVTYQLQTKTGENITAPKTISITRSLIQNANQVYTPNATQLMKREITRTVVILIYHDLLSQGTRQALDITLKQHRHR